MKYARLEAPGRVGLAERPRPTAGPGEIVVRMAECGLCGTDLEKFRGGYTASAILGHEPVGTIEAIGTGVDGHAVGERVFAHHHVPCLECAVCARGDYMFCPRYSATNLDPCGFAEAFRVSADHVRKGAVLSLDRRVSWDAGALLEPAGCVATALRRIPLPADPSIFVVGLGPAGLLYARLARARGASWVGGAEIAPSRRAAAERGGIDATVDPSDPAAVRALVDAATGGRGVDLAVVATGAPPAVTLACSLARRGGTVNLFGVPPAGSRLDVDLQEIYLRGVRLIPSYATTEADIAAVHELVVEGRLVLDDLVSHRIPLDRIAEAFQIASRPADALKVVVTGSPG